MVDKNTDFFKYVDNFSKTANIPSIPIIKSKIDFIPKITIAIPTYKRADLLKESIDSALNQIKYSEFDVIVVDNNPERDCETEKLLYSYKNPQLSYYKNSQNIQMAGNWNRLFTLAKAEYVVMLHDDDIIAPSFLNDCMQYINDEPDLGILKPNSKSFIDGESINFPNTKEITKTKLQRIYDISNYNHFALGAPSGCIFRKQAVLTVGGFNQELYPTMDICFVTMFSNYFKVYKLNRVLSYYRWGFNESLNTSTITNFIYNDYYLRKQLLSKYKIPKIIINIFLCYVTGYSIEFYKKINKEFDYDLKNLNLRGNHKITTLLSRAFIKLYITIIIKMKKVDS